MIPWQEAADCRGWRDSSNSAGYFFFVLITTLFILVATTDCALMNINGTSWISL